MENGSTAERQSVERSVRSESRRPAGTGFVERVVDGIFLEAGIPSADRNPNEAGAIFEAPGIQSLFENGEIGPALFVRHARRFR